jgi:hypothetical protein
LSLLTLVQDATDRLGIVRPTAVIGTSDTQVRQLLGLAQQEGKELARRYAWQALTREKTFTSTATEVQSSALPTDFDRFVKDTFYNRSDTRIVSGPLTAQEYQDYKSRLTSIVYDAFRVRGNDILILPTPAAGLTFAFEYISNAWCRNAAATVLRSAWAADDDTGMIDEEIMTLGLQWRFLKAKGFDYGEAFQSYEAHVAAVIGRDGGSRTLNMASGFEKRLPRSPIPPDGNWNIT